jgi:hypothetical protein
MDGEGNKREFTRVPVQVPIELQAAGRSYPGLLTGNLSMKGLLLRTEAELAKDSPCSLRIVLAPGIAEIRAEARVVRVYPGALALQFTRLLGTESFEHLRRLVIYNASDPEKVEDEFHDHAGIKPRN